MYYYNAHVLSIHKYSVVTLSKGFTVVSLLCIHKPYCRPSPNRRTLPPQHKNNRMCCEHDGRQCTKRHRVTCAHIPWDNSIRDPECRHVLESVDNDECRIGTGEIDVNKIGQRKTGSADKAEKICDGGVRTEDVIVEKVLTYYQTFR